MQLYSSPSSYYSMIARLALLAANIPFEIRYMDIHLSKEQLKPWYIALNPGMTVPTLVNGQVVLTDSHDILNFAAATAGEQWADTDQQAASAIQQVVKDQYAIIIEHFTFGKAWLKIPPARWFIKRMLGHIVTQLEKALPTATNQQAVMAKLTVDKGRLAYFSQADLQVLMEEQRQQIRQFLTSLPKPTHFLFGEKISSADIVTAVLFARLKMIGEYDLVRPFPWLDSWFTRLQTLPAVKQADLWLHFQPWRIFLKY